MIFQKHYITSTALGTISLLLLATPAFAHVIVTPKQVGIAQTQVFDMAVPTEKDVPTVEVRLLIPNGVQEVTPNVKPGWTIHVVKSGDVVTEIDWTDGAIPPDQRDDFLFQAQAPASEVTLKWKAVQTYQDGTTVEWIHDPTSNPEDDSAPPPYSTTKVINDLTGTKVLASSNRADLPLIFSIAALALSALSFGIVLRKGK